MKRQATMKPLHFMGLAELSAVCLMIAAFIAGTYVEQAIWALPDRVNFRQCLPWFILFTAGTMYFNSAFDLARRMHRLAFSMFTSILMVNVLMMALPFFEVLYYVQVTTLFIIAALECVCMAAWILIFHHLWVRFMPPESTVILCDDPVRGGEIAAKINGSSLTNRVDAVKYYDADHIGSAISPFEAVVLVRPPLESKNDIALECWNQRKSLYIVPDIYELIINNASLTQFDDLMTYQVKSIGLSYNQRFFKRAFDIMASASALLLLSPLMLVLAVIVKGDGGPALFSQERVTRGGRVFRLYKFRTMVPDAEKYSGPTLALKDDPRITRAGKWLRQTRLDELPQFWNVLVGDMSVVGPRPEREFFINLYLESLPEYQYRTSVRAGITGLAHVLGKYSTTPEERIKLDLTYIQNYSFSLDLKIMIETVRVIFAKEYAEGVEPTRPKHGDQVKQEEKV